MKADHYGPFVERFMSMVAPPPSFVHAGLTPGDALEKALAAPVTEIATFYFDGKPPAEYVANAMEFVKILEGEKAEGFLSAAAGTTVEVLEREGVKGQGAVVVIGWSSVDVHMKFRESTLFKENIGMLRQGAGKIEMHHTQFMKYV